MIRHTAAVLALGLLAVPAAAQEQSPWGNKFFAGKAPKAPPVIVHDFGTLAKGTVRTFRFPMTNIYTIPMQVTPRQPSCGCVAVKEYTAKMDPLQTGVFEVEINTSRVDGKKDVRVRVDFEGKDPKTGQPFFSWADLEIRAVIRQDIVINPGAVEFKVVPAGKASQQTATLTYYGTQQGWRVTDVGYRKDAFDVKLDPQPADAFPRGARAMYKLTATLKDTAPAGAFDEVFVLKTNDRANPVLNLNVTGMVQAPLGIVGLDKHKFAPVKVGEKAANRAVIIQSDKLFTVTAVEGQADGFSVTLIRVPANKKQVITIEFSPLAVGPVKKTLTIRTDTGESVPFTVEGTGLPADAKEPDGKTDPKTPSTEKKP